MTTSAAIVTGAHGSRILALLGASVLWGTTGTAASLLPGTVSPLATGSATMGIGGLLLFAVSGRGALGVIGDRRVRRWLLLGALGVVVYPLAFYSSMDLVGVAIGNVVALGSGPLFAALLEWAIDGARPTRRWTIATIIAVVGIGALSSGGHGAATESSDATVAAGLGLGLVAGAAYALYTYSSSRIIGSAAAGAGSRHSGRATMGAVFGIGAIGLLPVLAITGAPLLKSPSTIAVSAYLALAPMFLAYLLFGFALGRLSSTSVVTITLVEPVIATILAVAVVGERLGVLGWAGLALILVGVVTVSTARRVGGAPLTP